MKAATKHLTTDTIRHEHWTTTHQSTLFCKQIYIIHQSNDNTMQYISAMFLTKYQL